MRSIPRKSILVVEDNEDDLFLLRRGFKKAEFDPPVDVAADGKMAIDFLGRCIELFGAETQPFPALILLDLQLPYFNGFQVLQWMRGQRLLARVPVVILTSSLNNSDIERAYEAGANAYLVKPSDVDEHTRIAQGIRTFWFELNQTANFRHEPA